MQSLTSLLIRILNTSQRSQSEQQPVMSKKLKLHAVAAPAQTVILSANMPVGEKAADALGRCGVQEGTD